jgi:hypothetical protein
MGGEIRTSHVKLRFIDGLDRPDQPAKESEWLPLSLYSECNSVRNRPWPPEPCCLSQPNRGGLPLLAARMC